MSGGDIVLVVVATFAAGFLNAVAGGGSLVSFPALVATGLSPLTANVSNTLALWPGYVSGAASLSANLRRGVALRRLCAAAGVGAVAGSVALLAVDAEAFEAVVPFLVLLAAGLLAVPTAWLARLRPAEARVPEPVEAEPAAAGAAAEVSPPGPEPAPSAPSAPAAAPPDPAHPKLALVAVTVGGAYGAYFGGALGVVLLAVLSALVVGDLRTANATKNVLSLLVNTVALVAFVGFAPVSWAAVAAGAPASLVGGLAGARASTRLHPVWLRRAIVAYATVAGLVMLVT